MFLIRSMLTTYFKLSKIHFREGDIEFASLFFSLIYSQTWLKRTCSKADTWQGMKFRVNDRFVYASFMQCLLCTNDYRFSKMLLPIGSIFLSVQSKEYHFWIFCTFRDCNVYNFVSFFFFFRYVCVYNLLFCCLYSSGN